MHVSKLDWAPAWSPAETGLSLISLVGICLSALIGTSVAHADGAQADDSRGGVADSGTAGAATSDAATSTGTAATRSADAGSANTSSANTSSADANARNALQEVTVAGVRSLLHDKLAQTQQDTPQSVTVVNSQIMADQGNTRLEDALKNVPGITLNAGEGAARGDTVNLRGFSAFNDFYLDGIRDAAVYTRDDFDLESVEVLKGPSAVLFGPGSTGGAINQVTKAPLLTPFANVTAELGTNDLYRTTADLDTPIAPAAAARLNLMGESSDVAGRDQVHNGRWGVAPALGFGLGGADSLTLAYLHQQEDDVPDTGIPFVNGRPAPVPRDSYYGLASNRTTANDDIFTAFYRHEFTADVSLTDTLRVANYDFDYVFDAPNFGSDVPAPGEPLGDILVGRDAPASSGVTTNLDDQIDLSARFSTGFVTHAVLAGVELERQRSLIDRYVNPFNTNNNYIPETPLLDPDPYEVSPVEPISSQQYTVAPSGGLYAIDTLGFGPYVDLTAGFRYDYFGADYQQLTESSGTLLHLTQINRLGSPRAALLIKPTPRQSYYLSYGTSFDPSAEDLTLTTKTADLGPEQARTYEAGAKTEWLDDQLLLTGAVFHTEVDNAQTNDPDNPNITLLEGDQRVQGIEIGAEGHLTRHWELFSGYTYLDGRTLASGTAADIGKIMPNVAHNSLNLWTEYQLRNWEVAVGSNWLSHRFADSGETANVPGYVVWNAMASYAVTPSLTLQLNGFNLLNRLYYDALYYTSASENHAIPGPGRSLMLSARLSLR